jgi:hypothetical protein
MSSRDNRRDPAHSNSGSIGWGNYGREGDGYHDREYHDRGGNYGRGGNDYYGGNRNRNYGNEYYGGNRNHHYGDRVGDYHDRGGNYGRGGNDNYGGNRNRNSGMNTMVETGITTTVIESGQSEEMKTKIRAALRQFLKDRTQLLN